MIDFDDDSEKMDLLPCKPVRTGFFVTHFNNLDKVGHQAFALHEGDDTGCVQTCVRLKRRSEIQNTTLHV